MDTGYVFILAAVAFLLIKHFSQVSPQKARSLIEANAMVIDVRTAQEFAGGHIDNAINLPLDEIAEKIETVCTDRKRPLLLYCLSGTRSALAARILRRLAYGEVHNLGSLMRARAILK
jgi:phage shock protein E